MNDVLPDDSALPRVQRVAEFRLRVPNALTLERVVELARGVAPRLEVQARGVGWSESVPLVLLDFDDSGLELTMRRSLDGEELVVHGEADWVDLAADEGVAEQCCVKVLTALCEEGGARVISSRFASGAAIPSAIES